ncbi:hypothetical protein F383_27569 [Gossypium arboreum]|uniref:Uncharacterized protein n=1 Tax=Gossypium arboreum TaxID=29729 RepID=A0A0B0PBM7_GOSAR|nr:hypothetical protein F383_27569 [Gossypium arboreum]
MILISSIRQENRVIPCQDMALISYYKAKVPCKTMPRHGIGEFIKARIPCKTMSTHGNGKFQKDTT